MIYPFSDTKTQAALLTSHAADVDRLNMARAAMKPPLPPIVFNLTKALRLMRARVDRFYNGTSRYFPHQGEREMARRAQP